MRGKQLAERQHDVEARLKEVEEREAAVEREASRLQLVKQQLEQQMPDLRKLSEIMGAGAQEEREERDAKVLRILRSKDEWIARLKGEVEGLQGVLEETRAKLAATDKSLHQKSNEADRAWREHSDALNSSQVRLKCFSWLALLLRSLLQIVPHERVAWTSDVPDASVS